MNQGRIMQVGAPLELYDRPANKFVASFIGSPSMSFVSGTLGVEGNSAWFQTAKGERLTLSNAAPRTGEVEAGIRPEHFVAGGDGGVTVKVDVVEPTGSETHVYGAIGDDPVRAVFRDRIAVRPGEMLPVHVEPKNIHLFDKATGLPV
jgi:multiple sugar transport system ATP-binding protein